MKRILVAAMVFGPVVVGAQGAPPARPLSSVVPQPPTTLPLKHTPEPTSPDISAKDLMTRLYIFADDSMQGREAGKIGNVKGTDYIASEVKRFGLQPAGENGTYFQTIPLATRSTDPTSTLVAGGMSLALGTDWYGSAPREVASTTMSVVYGGDLSGDSTALLAIDQSKGKFVVLNMTTPSNRAIRAAFKYLPSASVVGIVLPAQVMAAVGRPATVLNDIPPGAPVSGAQLYLSADGAAKLFDAPLAQLKAGDAGKALAIDLKPKFDPSPYPARNVVAILPGSDPKLRGEYVALGGHNDHIGFNTRPVDHDSIRIYNHIVRPGGAEDQGLNANAEQQAEVNKELAAWRAAHPGTARLDSIANGADDDGTGSVSVLEMAEKFAALKGADRPKRSILFVWHVGEEKGLFGSQYFTDHPTVPRDSIVAQLNIDMVGRGDAWDMTGLTKTGDEIHGNPNYVQLVGSRRLSTELGDLAETVNTQDKHGLSFDYSIDANGHPANIYCRSDHYEYARYGIPIIFFTTGGHSDYHQVTDEPEYIDYEHMARVDRFIADLALHVANLDHRIVVDHPKPNPWGGCAQ